MAETMAESLSFSDDAACTLANVSMHVAEHNAQDPDCPCWLCVQEQGGGRRATLSCLRLTSLRLTSTPSRLAILTRRTDLAFRQEAVFSFLLTDGEHLEWLSEADTRGIGLDSFVDTSISDERNGSAESSTDSVVRNHIIRGPPASDLPVSRVRPPSSLLPTPSDFVAHLLRVYSRRWDNYSFEKKAPLQVYVCLEERARWEASPALMPLSLPRQGRRRLAVRPADGGGGTRGAHAPTGDAHASLVNTTQYHPVRRQPAGRRGAPRAPRR